MKVLVCGGAGYIGSNMTAMLAAEGYEPIVFDNLSTGHRSAVRHVRAGLRACPQGNHAGLPVHHESRFPL